MAKHGGYMGGMPSNMGNLMKQAQRMQRQMEEKSQELEAKEYTVSTGGGAVELVMNGKYQGLYFLTEHVRVDSKRVNITEQEDQATDSVSGGWLIEIDNYQEAGNIEFDEGNGQHVMVSLREPEELRSRALRT